MGLILFILKIILIILLVVLGFILLLSSLILLVPIHYELSGDISDSWEFQIKGKVTYLLSMFKCLFSYEKEQFDMKLFIFGFQKKNDKDKTNLNQDDINESEINLQEQEVFTEKILSVEEETSILESETENSDTSECEEVRQKKVKAKKSKSKHVKSAKVKLAEKKFAKVKFAKDKRQKIKIKNESKKENKINFTLLKQELTDEHNKSVVKKICLELLYLLRHFKFRKIVTDLRFSTGDPAYTGQILGILCMLPVLYQYNFNVVPDFEGEKVYLKGEFFVKGKVRLIHILIAGLRLIFDKQVRIVVKKFLTLLEK